MPDSAGAHQASTVHSRMLTSNLRMVPATEAGMSRFAISVHEHHAVALQ